MMPMTMEVEPVSSALDKLGLGPVGLALADTPVLRVSFE